MAKETETRKVHQLAGGWITERAGTPIPTFLKMTYVGFCLFALYYMVAFWKGEVAHETRGALVREINQVMEVPGAVWLGSLFVILFVFVAGLLFYAFSAGSDED